MGNMEASTREHDTDGGITEVRLLCKVDVQRHELDVDWTNGAIFHFNSEEAINLWVESQNQRVPGTLHLKSDTPGSEILDPDYYLHYRPPVD